jgi:chromosome segregation ATPase
MDTASKPPQPARPTDRVLEALSTLAALIDRSINEVKALDSEFQNRIEASVSEARARLEEEFTKRIRDLTAESEAERNRMRADLEKISEAGVQWEAERTRLNAELEKLARVQAQTQAEAERAVMAMKAASAAAKTAKAGASVNSGVLNAEIQRIEGLIREISDIIENPATELSTVIRKNVERAELESYLKGIRFALNPDPPKL